MPRHIDLPEPTRIGSKRAETGFGDTPKRKPNKHGKRLKKQVGTANKAEGPRTTGVDPRRVFKVRATTRLKDGTLKSKGLQPLGESPDWDYFVIPFDEGAHQLKQAIRRYRDTAEGKTFFDNVEEFAPYGPPDRAGRGLEDPDLLEYPLVVDVHIWPAATGPGAKWRVRDVRKVVGDGEISADTQPAFLLIRAAVEQADLEELLLLSAVERVSLPPAPYLSPTDWVGAAASIHAQPNTRPGVVGIIDDGVESGHMLLDGIVDSFNVPDDRSWAPPTRHGTMVAGLAAYGDFETALREGGALPEPVKVVAARVVERAVGDQKATYPTNKPEHRILEEAIRELARRDVKVINISIADRDPYSGPHVDLRTEMIDSLIRELDLVVTICSGNVGADSLPTVTVLHDDHPAHLLEELGRIAEPAVAANALTVGSIARSEHGAFSSGDSPTTMRAVAAADEVSPFSRSGPGFHSTGSIKPDLVEYGGNLVSNAVISNRNIEDENAGAGAISLALPGPFATGSGTSFSAPRVARAAAVIRAEYPDASANLTRALLGLSARIPTPHQVPASSSADEKAAQLRLVGYGRPDEARAIESVSNRVVLTFDGEIDTDTSVIHEIPIPQEFAAGKADRSISVALAFDPPTRRFRREYLAARMKVDLYRNTDLGDLIEIMRAQPQRSESRSLISDRRRVNDRLRPASTAVNRSTLQVRRWRASAATSLNPDDGDYYYLVVTHTAENWADLADPEYVSQRYALAIELEDRSRQQVNIFERISERIQGRVRV